MKNWIIEVFIPKCIQYRQEKNDRENFPMELYDFLIENHFFEYFIKDNTFPKEIRREFLDILKKISEVYPILSVYISVQAVFGVYALTQYGNENQQKFRDNICSGKCKLSVAWNEEISGSNLENIESNIVRLEDDSIILNANKSKISFMEYSNSIAVFALERSADFKSYPRIIYIDNFGNEVKINKGKLIGGMQRIRLNDIKIKDFKLSSDSILLDNTESFIEIDHLYDIFNWCISTISISTAAGMIKSANKYFNVSRRLGEKLINSPTISKNIAISYTKYMECFALYKHVINNSPCDRKSIATLKASTYLLLDDIVKLLSPFIYKTAEEDTFIWLSNDSIILKRFTGSLESQIKVISQNIES